MIRLGSKIISASSPVFIVAEAGVNHNGSLVLAKKLVDAAKAAGADAVKFQTFKAENLVIQSAPLANYQQKNIGKSKSQLAMLKDLALPYKDFIILKRYCEAKKIIFLSTPHSEDAVDFLAPLVPAYKIGSGDLTNIPFLEKIAKKGKPLIVPTGMADLEEVRLAVKTIKSAGNNKIILLHCTSQYPCPPQDVNLKAMNTMMKIFPTLLIGYSDHTIGLETSVMAVTLGAKLIEKHFTLDKKMSGPDHKASANPRELKSMIEAIRAVPIILGQGIKKPTAAELKIRSLVRKSVVSLRPIKKNEKFSGENLGCKRPGTGLPPKCFKILLGRRAKKNIAADQLIKKSDI